MVRPWDPAIAVGLAGLPRTQGAGGRADVVCGRAITASSTTSIGWATGLADEGTGAGQERVDMVDIATAGLESAPRTKGAGHSELGGAAAWVLIDHHRQYKARQEASSNENDGSV